MDLTPLQLRIVSHVQLRARVPLTQIAREVGCNHETARRCISLLLERGILKPYTLVDTCSLGFIEYAVYFSYSSGSPEEREKLVRTLVESPLVGTVAKFGGDFQYVILVYVRHPGELESFLRALGERHPGGLFEKHLVSRLSWTAFNAKYLCSDRTKVFSLRYDYQPLTENISELDHRLLELLSEDPLLSHTELAREVGVARSTIEYHLQSLISRKVILGFGHWLDTGILNVQMFRFLIQANRVTSKLAEALYSFARDHLNVGGFVRSVGSWDFELRVEAREARTIGLIHQALLDRFGSQINSIKVLTLFQNLKNIFYPKVFGSETRHKSSPTVGR